MSGLFGVLWERKKHIFRNKFPDEGNNKFPTEQNAICLNGFNLQFLFKWFLERKFHIQNKKKEKQKSAAFRNNFSFAICYYMSSNIYLYTYLYVSPSSHPCRICIRKFRKIHKCLIPKTFSWLLIILAHFQIKKNNKLHNKIFILTHKHSHSLVLAMKLYSSWFSCMK